MTKSEDDTANDVEQATTEASVEPVTEEAKAPKRHGWRKRTAAPRNEPEVVESDVVEPEPELVESKAEELTVESKVEAPTVETHVEAPTIEAPAAATVVAPRIRGAAVDEADLAGEEVDPTPLDATESDDFDGAPAEAVAEGIPWSRVLAYGVLPGLALILALTAGFLKYVDNSVRDNEIASIESVQAAKDSTVALLSYKPETVEKQLGDARGLLTGEFAQSYTDLTTNVVIPGAKQQQISASARVPAAASVSANSNHAVVLVFVNQTVVVGTGAPADTASSVRVTLDKVGDKWLISKFDPV
jgi:Mce-associated membrane protein